MRAIERRALARFAMATAAAVTLGFSALAYASRQIAAAVSEDTTDEDGNRTMLSEAESPTRDWLEGTEITMKPVASEQVLKSMPATVHESEPAVLPKAVSESAAPEPMPSQEPASPERASPLPAPAPVPPQVAFSSPSADDSWLEGHEKATIKASSTEAGKLTSPDVRRIRRNNGVHALTQSERTRPRAAAAATSEATGSTPPDNHTSPEEPRRLVREAHEAHERRQLIKAYLKAREEASHAAALLATGGEDAPSVFHLTPPPRPHRPNPPFPGRHAAAPSGAPVPNLAKSSAEAAEFDARPGFTQCGTPPNGAHAGMGAASPGVLVAPESSTTTDLAAPAEETPSSRLTEETLRRSRPGGETRETSLEEAQPVERGRRHASPGRARVDEATVTNPAPPPGTTPGTAPATPPATPPATAPGHARIESDDYPSGWTSAGWSCQGGWTARDVARSLGWSGPHLEGLNRGGADSSRREVYLKLRRVRSTRGLAAADLQADVNAYSSKLARAKQSNSAEAHRRSLSGVAEHSYSAGTPRRTLGAPRAKLSSLTPSKTALGRPELRRVPMRESPADFRDFAC